MKNDFEMIVRELPRDLDKINVYPLGDLHIGSPEFSYNKWDKWKHMVKEDKNGYIVIIGDLMDNGLIGSKTNPYEAVMTPTQQKKWLLTEFKDFMAERLLGATQGNHEYRTNILIGESPLYEVMRECHVQDLYRPNMAFIKVNLGTKTKDRQYSYSLVLCHGASKGKKDKFAPTIDGMDCLISGHTHDAHCDFPAKIVMDTKNNVVREVGYATLVVPSFLEYGGYGMRAMYTPKGNHKIPVIELSGTRKNLDICWR